MAIFFLTTSSSIFVFWKVSLHSEHKIMAYILFISLVYLILNIMVFVLLLKMNRDNLESQELKQLALKNKTENQMYTEITEQYEKLQMFRHDLKIHSLQLENLLKQGNLEEALNYILKTKPDNPNVVELFPYTKNEKIDVVLSSKRYLAESKGITINFKIMIVPQIITDEISVCLILSNLLDNAINASENSSSKQIEVSVITDKQNLLITVKNSVDKEVLIENPKLLTTNKNKKNHGLGIKSIKNLVDKAQGTIHFNNDTASIFFTNRFCF
ncbi:MAG: GHKL domain-containing protein [Oscillospiraceae bacterium]|nr:GHKL domain-containing protein [Oscillospiraceae bacterium]